MSAAAERLRDRWGEIRRVAPGLTEDEVLAHVHRISERHEHLKRFPAVLPGKAMSLLEGVARKLKALNEALGELRDTDPELHRDIAVPDGLKEFPDRVKGAKPTEVPAAGGGGHSVRRVKEAAARSSYELLARIGAEPTAPRGSKWVKLTAILLEVADGPAGDVGYACKAVFEKSAAAEEEPLPLE